MSNTDQIEAQELRKALEKISDDLLPAVPEQAMQWSPRVRKILGDIATVARSALAATPATASEQADTKRLEWLFLTDEGWQWLADNLSYVRAHHRRPYFTNAIDAAMRKEAK